MFNAVEDSKKLNDFHEPIVIISASGMCESGRILHHLANNMSNPNNTIMIVGYQAEKPSEEESSSISQILKIFGDEYRLKAEVVEMHSFSAHADHDDLVNFTKNFDNGKLQNIFLVHGEPQEQSALSQSLTQYRFKSVHSPKRGDVYNL